MLRSAGAGPPSATGFPSSPVTVADTAACAAAGASSAQLSVAAATASAFFLDFIPYASVGLRPSNPNPGDKLRVVKGPRAKMGPRTYGRPRRSAAPLPARALRGHALVPHGFRPFVRGAARVRGDARDPAHALPGR